MNGQVEAGFNPAACWEEVRLAVLGSDDRRLWLAWRKHYPTRFWKQMGQFALGPMCDAIGVPYAKVLRRLTAYEMDPLRDMAADRELLRRESSRPPPPMPG
jgi:hypothetical protein